MVGGCHRAVRRESPANRSSSSSLPTGRVRPCSARRQGRRRQPSLRCFRAREFCRRSFLLRRRRSTTRRWFRTASTWAKTARGAAPPLTRVAATARAAGGRLLHPSALVGGVRRGPTCPAARQCHSWSRFAARRGYVRCQKSVGKWPCSHTPSRSTLPAAQPIGSGRCRYTASPSCKTR